MRLDAAGVSSRSNAVATREEEWKEPRVSWRSLVLSGLFEAASPFARFVDAEWSQRITIKLLAMPIFAEAAPASHPVLKTSVCGLDFDNPIILAAGLDKNGVATDGLWGRGFGALEIGTVTPRAQIGNDKPRLWRLPDDRAVFNRFGFNNDGIPAALNNLQARQYACGPLGVNIGKNKDSADELGDYVEGVRHFKGIADYLVVNISSPNTPGLRDLQAKESMRRLLVAVIEERERRVAGRAVHVPLFVKLAPDLDDEGLREAAFVALDAGIDGIVMGNTTIGRPVSLKHELPAGPGGLSGRPLTELSTRQVAKLYALSEGRLPLIGCGGVSSGADAYAKIRAGASLVQLYSALVYEGPRLPARIKRELSGLLRRDGFASVGEAVGVDAG